MDCQNFRYTRADAISEGRLIDVSYLNRKEYNPFPTFVSVGLWEACRRERPPRRPAGYFHPQARMGLTQEDRIYDVITLLPLFRWLERGKCGQLSMHVGAAWLSESLEVQVVVEPSKRYGRIVTILLEDEKLDFRVPRPAHGGSFFVM